VTQRWNPDFSTTLVIGTDINESSLDSVKVTDYAGNKIYENGELKRVLVDGGYIENNAYHFYLKDHLGNNRVVINQNDSIIQRNHYYPFGMEFADNSGDDQPYKYNGKELNRMHGLNMYDYSARHMALDVPRFTTVDPLAEIYYNISPYVYCNNNPIKFIDPTGMAFRTSDQNQISDFFGYMANGGNLSSYDMNGWEETEDPEPPTDGEPQKPSESSKTITPWGVGVEWLTGKGARHRNFTDGDFFTELLKKHEHLEKVRKGIIAYLTNGTSYSKKQPYSLSNWDGALKYVKDYSTLTTFGLTGNLAVTYLGSYNLIWSIRSIDSSKGLAVIEFSVNNNSTIQSATHPPVIGYTDFWIQNIGDPLNAIFSSGPMSKTSQSFNWTETLNLR